MRVPAPSSSVGFSAHPRGQRAGYNPPWSSFQERAPKRAMTAVPGFCPGETQPPCHGRSSLKGTERLPNKGSARSFQASSLNMSQTSTHMRGLATGHCWQGTQGRAVGPRQ